MQGAGTGLGQTSSVKGQGSDGCSQFNSFEMCGCHTINGNIAVPAGRNAGIYEIINPSVFVPSMNHECFPRHLLLCGDQMKRTRPRIPG